MESLLLLGANLLSPPVIAFTTGLVAVWARSDLRFPEQAYQVLTIYLLLAIGFKGGIALTASSPAELLLPIGATFLIGAIIPVGVFFTVRKFLKFDVSNAAAMAAHYGSVSAVTFMACLAFLDRQAVEYEAFMPAIMATMEIPAIFVALLLAMHFKTDRSVPLRQSVREVVSGKSLILLVSGLISGAVSGEESRELIKPFLITPFYGVLMLFLLEMGLVAGEKIRGASQVGYKLIVFALISPVIQGVCGLLLGWSIGLSQGGSVVFAILAASASYIAAPAAVRISLPEANPGYYVTASLGITFPFNLVVGIPLLFSISNLLY
ncbi:MAG: hypothetical protein ACJAYS_001069 [Lentimonas sp.]|jgi:hypothetical protein